MNLEVRLPEPLPSDVPRFAGIAGIVTPPSLTLSISHYSTPLSSPSMQLFSEANRFADMGDWANAREKYKALTKIASDVIPYYLLGRASYEAGDIDGAMSAFRKAIKLARNAIKAGKPAPGEIVAGAHFGLAVIFLGLDRVDDALRELREVIRLDGQNEDAYFALGLIQCQRRQWQLAVHAFEKAIELKEDFAEAYLRLGQLYTYLGEAEEQNEYFSKAIDTYTKLLRVFPRTSSAYSDIGVLLTRIGDPAAAIEAFEKAVEANPSNVLALTNLGSAYLVEQRFEDAARAFEKAIPATQISPPKDRDLRDILARQYLGLGVALVGLYRSQPPAAKDSGMLSGAESAYTQAIETDPPNAIAHSNLAAVYSELGRTEDAEREMLTAVQLDPEDQVARASFDSMIADRYSSMAEDGAKQQRTRDRLRLLGSLLEGDDEEQRETFAFLKQALEEDRLSSRRRFTE